MILSAGSLLTRNRGGPLREPNVPSLAFQTPTGMANPLGANAYYLGAKFGQPLTFTGFTWFYVPSYNMQDTYNGYSFLQHYGSIVNEDIEVYPGVGMRLQASGSGVNDPFGVVLGAYGFDGFNQVYKFGAVTRNPANTVTTFPLSRKVWYSLYWSINFDDSNACEIWLGRNTQTGCTTTWYGDTDPLFPIVPFNPITVVGNTTYFMGVVFSAGGGEAACDQGYDGLGGFVLPGASPPNIVNRAANCRFFQSWADTAVDTTGTGHLRFVTPQNHWMTLDDQGQAPFGNTPGVFFTDDAAIPPNNAGYNGLYTVNGSINYPVTGPV